MSINISFATAGMVQRKPVLTGTLYAPYADNETAQQKFERLRNNWKRDTSIYSVDYLKVNHWAYKEILAMGEQIIPFMLDDLAHSRARWFTALQELTGSDPVSTEIHGDFQAMASAWVDWGRTEGYL